MFLSDWYEANRVRLATDGFDVEFSTVEDSQILRADGDLVCFDFMANGQRYADFALSAAGGEEAIGRIDEPPDVGAYFEEIYRAEVLRRIGK